MSPPPADLPTGLTAHLKDPIRVQIAIALVCRELKKLLPSVAPGQIAGDLRKLADNMGIDRQVIDFWNLTDAMMGGYKRKSIIRQLTNEKFVWTLEPLSSGNAIICTTDYPDLKCRGNSFGAIRDDLHKHPDLCRHIEQLTRNIYEPRLESLMEPILVIERGNRKQYVLDGNGRLFAEMFGLGSIQYAYVGRRNGRFSANSWVSEQFLSTLIESTDANQNVDMLEKLVRESENALFVFLMHTTAKPELRNKVLERIGRSVNSTPVPSV